MDQTTETADLTETEKYLRSFNRSTVESSDSSDIDDDDDVAQDALLGGIRCGLNTMTKTARNSLSTCKNTNELDDAISNIKTASLKLLKMEKSFLKTASIVSEVVNDLVSDFEDEDDDDNSQSQCVPQEKVGNDFKKGAGDAKVGDSRQKPYIFRPSEKNLVSLRRFKDKLKREYDRRMDEYKDTLTEDILKEDKKFEALLQQIKLGKNDAETAVNFNKVEEEPKSETPGQDETELSEKSEVATDTDNATFLSSLPFTEEQLKNHEYKPYNEDKEMDHSVLPSVDPISKSLIAYPVRNIFCNHVFDRASIYAFIAGNPDATCPVHMCRNKRKLERCHFCTDSILTNHIRQKNNF